MRDHGYGFPWMARQKPVDSPFETALRLYCRFISENQLFRLCKETRRSMLEFFPGEMRDIAAFVLVQIRLGLQWDAEVRGDNRCCFRGFWLRTGYNDGWMVGGQHFRQCFAAMKALVCQSPVMRRNARIDVRQGMFDEQQMRHHAANAMVAASANCARW